MGADSLVQFARFRVHQWWPSRNTPDFPHRTRSLSFSCRVPYMITLPGGLEKRWWSRPLPKWLRWLLPAQDNTIGV